MTEPSDVTPLSAAPYLGGQVGPGRNIRMAREAAGLSLEELATQMRLARATLDALERDDFSTLSEPVYIRGYYRKCAKALNLSEAELLTGYERLAAPKAPPPPTKLLLANSDAGSVGGRRGGLRWVAAVLLAVLIGAVLFLSTRSGEADIQQKAAEAPAAVPESQSEPLSPASSAPVSEASSAVPPPPPAAVTSTAATAAEPVSSAPAHSETTAPTVGAPVVATLSAVVEAPKPTPPPASTTAPAATPAVTTPVSTAPEAPKPAGSSELKLSFRGTSWVRVQDATGKTLLSGVIENGEQQTLTGLPPYAVFLGNAPSVDVEYGGQPVKLDSYVKGNSTARFNVPATP